MGIKKIGITISILAIGSFTFYFNNANVKDTASKEDIENTLSLMNITETMILVNKDVEEVADNSDNTSNKKTNNEEIDLAVNKMNKIKEPNNTQEENITTSEDKDNIKNPNTDDKPQQPTENKKPVSTPSRGDTPKKEEEPQVSSKSLNQYVLDVISTYSLGKGEYPYLLNNDFENYNGVTEDLYYKGELILKANPAGDRASNCTGISFEVFFKAMQKRNKELGIAVDDFNSMSKDELFDMALTWFVAKGPKSESNLAVAIEKYGLGTRINNLEDARPGDFIDLSRENNSGHAVVFIDWIRKDSKIIGLKFWSSQGSTDGISYKKEYFNIKDKNGNKYGGVRLDNLHIVRVSPVSEYTNY